MTKTVNLDTAVCTYDEMAKLNDTQLGLTYAIYSVMESKLYYFARKHDASEDPNFLALRQKVTDAVDNIRAAFIANYPEKCFMWYFGGSTTSELLTYKAIENAITKEFGTEGIWLMSERDEFRLEISDTKKEALEKFLQELDPDLDFWSEPNDKEDIGAPIVGGWDVTEEIVKKAGIKVVVEMPELTPKPQKQIHDMMVNAAEILQKTGLQPADAVAELAGQLGVVINGSMHHK